MVFYHQRVTLKHKREVKLASTCLSDKWVIVEGVRAKSCTAVQVDPLRTAPMCASECEEKVDCYFEDAPCVTPLFSLDTARLLFQSTKGPENFQDKPTATQAHPEAEVGTTDLHKYTRWYMKAAIADPFFQVGPGVLD